MTSSVSVMSSPSLRSRGLPQHRQTVGPGSTTRSRGRCSGKGWRAGRLRVKATTFVGLGHGVLGGDLVLGRRTLELLEGQRHLIEQLHAAFRALAVELARQLGDLQPLMRDQGLIIGSLGLGHCQFGLDPRRSFTLRDQRRLQRGDVVGEVIGRRRHEPDYPTSAGPSAPSTIR